MDTSGYKRYGIEVYEIKEEKPLYGFLWRGCNVKTSYSVIKDAGLYKRIEYNPKSGYNGVVNNYIFYVDNRCDDNGKVDKIIEWFTNNKNDIIFNRTVYVRIVITEDYGISFEPVEYSKSKTYIITCYHVPEYIKFEYVFKCGFICISNDLLYLPRVVDGGLEYKDKEIGNGIRFPEIVVGDLDIRGSKIKDIGSLPNRVEGALITSLDLKDMDGRLGEIAKGGIKTEGKRDAYVYLLINENDERYTKIGKSVNLCNREKTLQAQVPTYRMYKYLEFNSEGEAFKFEKKLHKRYSEYRLRGSEWFELPKGVLEELVKEYNWRDYDESGCSVNKLKVSNRYKTVKGKEIEKIDDANLVKVIEKKKMKVGGCDKEVCNNETDRTEINNKIKKWQREVIELGEICLEPHKINSIGDEVKFFSLKNNNQHITSFEGLMFYKEYLNNIGK